MSDLHDRLTDLAEDAPSVSEPGDLWRRGRRHRTRRLLATGAATVVVAAVVGVGATAGVQRAQTLPEPAAPAGVELQLPDTFWGPGAWLSLLGTVGEGDTPGPLVALVATEYRTWTGQQFGTVAVSSQDQQYRVLDLPDQADATRPPSLSPDGRYVVYRTSTSELAAYDTETGEVDRVPLESTDPDLELVDPLPWLGDTVIFQEPYAEGSATVTDPTTTRAWTMGEDAAVAVDDPRILAGSLPSTQTSGPVVVEVGTLKLMVLRGPADLTGTPVTEVDRVLNGNVVLSPDGTRVAAAVRTKGGGSELAVGVLTPGTTTLTTVPGTAPLDEPLIGWRDDTSVVTTGLGYGGELTAIDVTTGEQRTLTTTTDPTGYASQLAADAVTAPLVPGVEPPSPPDPRWVGGGAALLVLLVTGAVLAWRRRRVG